MLLGLALLLAWVWVGEWRKRLALALLSVVVASLALAGIRFGLFGSFFPLPVAAKAEGLSLFRIYKGLGYLYHSSVRHPDFLALGILAAVGWIKWIGKGKETPPARRLLALTALAGSLFVLASGGDWMENGRFWVPVLPLAALLAIDVAKGVKWLIPLLLGLQLLGIVWTAHHHSSGRPLWEVPTEPASYSFVERANRFHYRDIATVQALQPLVDSLHQELHRPVRILSQQAGMVIFHLAKSHPQKIHFTDLVGLSTLDFHNCPPIRDRGKGFGGLNMDLLYLFEDFEALSSKCNFQKPDLIFDLDNDRRLKRSFLVQQGYQIVYEQEGLIENGPLFPGLEVSAIQFIALRPTP